MPTATKTSKKKAAPITVNVTLADFDTQDLFRVMRDDLAIQEFTPLTLADYQPRGGTPLRDATAKMIAHLSAQQSDGKVVVGVLLDRSGSMGGKQQSVVSGVNEFIGGMAAVEKVDAKAAGTVLCVVVTDGQENSSREVSAQALSAMTAEKEKQGWTFIYMGANQDAWDTGATQMGLSGTSSGQSINYVDTEKGRSSAFASLTSRGVGYIGDHGQFPVAFAANASVLEDGAETSENTALTPEGIKAAQGLADAVKEVEGQQKPTPPPAPPTPPAYSTQVSSDDALKKATDSLLGKPEQKEE